MQELKLQPGTLPGAKSTHPSQTKERGGNTAEPTERIEEPVSITADNIIYLYDTCNNTRKPPAAFYTYKSHIDIR